ncbi:unnamed protein product [Didymodactylos carnosus]|uniref:Purple acid phosphatase C-terminal domain-containing protein n=1 Tax=Didymodactylos carnosus TaxID=1234261 RepID=A0A816BN19_9BILA|nr:unnamed protein product [Didymodactylos carnosus]CAF4493167.1 unnamed protein product [Didymodactylos carnosus]
MLPVLYGKINQTDYNNPPVPIYITSGAGGSPECGLTSKYTRQSYSAFIQNNQCGFGQLKVINRTYAEWKFYNVNNLETPIDQIQIRKNH